MSAVEEIQNINRRLREDSSFEVTEGVLKPIVRELLFAPVANPLFITEVNIFLHNLHERVFGSKHYGDIAKDINTICILSYNLSETVKEINAQPEGPKAWPISLVGNMKEMGQILARIAPYLRSIAGIITLIESTDIQFFG